jgi:hypothetical protein
MSSKQFKKERQVDGEEIREGMHTMQQKVSEDYGFCNFPERPCPNSLWKGSHVLAIR